MGRNFALNTLQIKEALAFYNKGKSANAIANVYSVSPSAVRNALSLHVGKLEPRYYRVQWTLEQIRLRCTVDKNECWLWAGAIKPNGYGYLRSERKTIYAHRLAFKLSGRRLINGRDVCHVCDVRSCCNPEHLFLGTRADNMQDAKTKGRLSMGVVHGLRVKEAIQKRKAREITLKAKAWGATATDQIED